MPGHFYVAKPFVCAWALDAITRGKPAKPYGNSTPIKGVRASRDFLANVSKAEESKWLAFEVRAKLKRRWPHCDLLSRFRVANPCRAGRTSTSERSMPRSFSSLSHGSGQVIVPSRPSLSPQRAGAELIDNRRLKFISPSDKDACHPALGSMGTAVLSNVPGFALSPRKASTDTAVPKSPWPAPGQKHDRTLPDENFRSTFGC